MEKKAYEGFKWSEMIAHQPPNPTMDKPLIITVCPTGGTTTRRQNPYQPYTAEEIADQTIGAYEEGATVAHIHTRNPDGSMA